MSVTSDDYRLLEYLDLPAKHGGLVPPSRDSTSDGKHPQRYDYTVLLQGRNDEASLLKHANEVEARTLYETLATQIVRSAAGTKCYAELWRHHSKKPGRATFERTTANDFTNVQYLTAERLAVCPVPVDHVKGLGP